MRLDPFDQRHGRAVQVLQEHFDRRLVYDSMNECLLLNSNSDHETDVNFKSACVGRKLLEAFLPY